MKQPKIQVVQYRRAGCMWWRKEGTWIAPALCRKQRTTEGLWAKNCVITLLFEHPWLSSSARPFFKIRQKSFEINMVSWNKFHFVHSQDLAIQFALHWVTSSPFHDWMSFPLFSMATPDPASTPNWNKHHLSCDSSYSYLLLPPRSQDTFYGVSRRWCVPVTSPKSLCSIGWWGPMQAEMCILIYIHVHAHLPSSTLLDPCSVPEPVQDAGLQITLKYGAICTT